MKGLTFFILLSTCSFFATAQYVPIPMTITTPMGPIHTTHYVYMPHNYSVQSNPKFKFTVQLKNDSTVSFKSRMLVNNKKMYLEYKNKKKKVKLSPADTKSIIGFNLRGGLMQGIPADTCWLFRSGEKTIKTYSSIPSTDINTTIAIQKEAEILSLTKDNLREMVSDLNDEKIGKWIEKDHLVKAVEYYNKLKTKR